jgi:hypothetical protein
MFRPFLLVIGDSIRRWAAWWMESLLGRGSTAGQAAAILVGAFALGCAYLAFAEGFQNAVGAISIIATPEPTATPAPTPRPTTVEVDPTEAPLPTATLTPAPSATPQPTPSVEPTEAPAGPLGVSRAVLQKRYEQAGFIFQPAPATDGQLRVTGANPRTLATIELIGPADNITQAAMTLVMLDADAESQAAADLLTGLLSATLPDWADGPAWLEDQLNLAATISGTGGVVQSTESEHRVTFQLVLQGNQRLISLTVKGMGRSQ